MPLAHAAYRPHPEVELLRIRPLKLSDAILALEEAISGDSGDGAETVHTPGTSLISFQQIPRVLESLQSEWSQAPVSEQPSNCFSEVHGRLLLHMHPCFLGERLMEGMRGAAGLLLMRYHATLQHVPLGFTVLKPVNTHAAVVGENAYVHFLIEFHCVGFRPRVGDKLIGRLGTVQTAVGINCTIFNNFNFFVHKSDLPAEAWFDSKEGCWMLGVTKLGGKKNDHAICLELTKPVEENSGGSQPVNFKGILKSQLPGSTRQGGSSTNQLLEANTERVAMPIKVDAEGKPKKKAPEEAKLDDASKARVRKATASVEAVERSVAAAVEAAQQLLPSSSATMVGEALAELQSQSTVLAEAQKALTNDISEVRKGGIGATNVITKLSKLSPRLRSLQAGLIDEIARLKAFLHGAPKEASAQVEGDSGPKKPSGKRKRANVVASIDISAEDAPATAAAEKPSAAAASSSGDKKSKQSKRRPTGSS